MAILKIIALGASDRLSINSSESPRLLSLNVTIVHHFSSYLFFLAIIYIKYRYREKYKNNQ